MSVINLSSGAIRHLTPLLAQRPAGAGLRLAVKKSGCSGLKYLTELVDAPQADDITLKFDAVTVYLAPDSVEYVEGITLDYIDAGLGQKRLVFQNPNAQDACGCGESFSVAKRDGDSA